jgi:hypothetical protein
MKQWIGGAASVLITAVVFLGIGYKAGENKPAPVEYVKSSDGKLVEAKTGQTFAPVPKDNQIIWDDAGSSKH